MAFNAPVNILIQGVTGSGKTSLLSTLCEPGELVILSYDLGGLVVLEDFGLHESNVVDCDALLRTCRTPGEFSGKLKNVLNSLDMSKVKYIAEDTISEKDVLLRAIANQEDQYSKDVVAAHNASTYVARGYGKGLVWISHIQFFDTASKKAGGGTDMIKVQKEKSSGSLLTPTFVPHVTGACGRVTYVAPANFETALHATISPKGEINRKLVCDPRHPIAKTNGYRVKNRYKDKFIDWTEPHLGRMIEHAHSAESKEKSK